MLLSHLQIYVNLDEYDDHDYINFDMEADEWWWRITSGDQNLF